MASLLRAAVSTLNRSNGVASTRRRLMSTRIPEEQFDAHVDDLYSSVLKSVVLIGSSFSGHEDRYGGGVFISPTLLLTSAHLAGRIATSYEPKTVEKPDRFEHGRILHKFHMATKFTVSSAIGTLETKPLAVNFGYDVAVVKVVAPPPPSETLLPQFCSMAKSSPRKGDLLAILVSVDLADSGNFQWASGAANVRATGEKTFRVKAPWPLNNDSPWIEYDDYYGYGCGDDPTVWSSGYSFNSREELAGSLLKYHGNPIFNMDSELVGIASWFVGGKGKRPPFSVAFAVPLLSIRAVVEYAMTKKPDDPIVMDKWIEDS